MEIFKRYFFSIVFGIGITLGLVLLMAALITYDYSENPTEKYLTTQIKVSAAPGLAPSKTIDSNSQKKNYQLPSKRKIQTPINHKKLLSHIRSQEADGTNKDTQAAPTKQQRLLMLGSKSQAKVVLAGQFNVIGPDPQYPHEALMSGQEGWVEAKIHVKNDGSVEDIEIIDAGPAGIFELSVVTAVFDWKIQFSQSDVDKIQEEYFHRFEFKIAE